MGRSKGFTVFIPVYNEEAILEENATRLLRQLENSPVPFEIILGSNGSTDRTVCLARSLSAEHPNLRYFHLPRKGVGAALKAGLQMAAYDRIITVDMDLSIHLGFIGTAHRLLDRYDMVIGSKISGTQNRSLLRKAASKAFISLARLLLRIDYHDYSIAAKGYRKQLLEPYLPLVDDQTFYVVEVAYRAVRDGKRLIEIPVACEDLRGSRFNLLQEGVYKFGNLFRLWASRRLKSRPALTA